MLILLLVCSIGFGQQQIIETDGDNNPIRYGEQQNLQNVPNSSSTAATLNYESTPLFKSFSVLEQEEISAAEQEGVNSDLTYTPVVRNRGPLSDIIPTAGATESFAVVAGDFFYDPSDGTTGGPGGDCTTTSSGNPGDYPNCDCDTVTTLTGAGLSVEFLSFRIFGTFDYLNIYDGPDTSSPQIYDSNLNSDTDELAGMIAANGSAVFTSTTGALTFEFHATGVVNTCGWEVEVLSGGGGAFPAPYCGPLEYNSAVEPITLVDVAGISNVSDPVIDGSPAHEDFTSIVGDMEEGMTYPIALEGNTGGGFTNSFTVFIDWDQDGTLDNASERYEIGTITGSTGTDGQQATGNIVVPAGVTAGPTRMRVIKKFLASYAPDSCTPGSGFGQAEDYTINVTTAGGGGGICGTPILEVNQDIEDTCMANISQTDLAQSYIAQEPQSAGAGIKFVSASTGLDVNLSLWDGLPNAGGTMLASGTSQTDGTVWTDVFWDPVVDVTVGNTYYIVIDGDINLPCIAGSTADPYPGGNVYANAGYDPFPSFDYTFRTYSCDGGGGGGVACSEENPNDFTFENGFNCSSNSAFMTANDLTVAADTDFTLENITASIFANGGITNVDVNYYDDAAGLPGTLIGSEASVTIDNQTVIGSNFGFDVNEVEMTVTPFEFTGQAGSPTTYWIELSVTDGGATGSVFWVVTSSTMEGNPTAQFDGGWLIPDPVMDGVYIWEGMCETSGGGATYDDCAGAIAVSCGDSVVGETITATDSGGNSAPDVFYKFTGSGSSQLVTISLCGGGTDYDSALRVFDDCDLLNEIAFNDDFCGLQSEVTFVSDGTSTYYIMVEGFGSSSGNFSLDVTCQDPLPNDECSGAIAVSCGDSVTGSTVGATIDAGAPACGPAITSPGVWYSFNDNSGLPGDITVSLCNGTDFDSKLSIYSGDCGALVCVDGNDDFCGLQSEVTFASDGNTQYYILVHSFGGATGNFTLDVTCMPTPPPNDMIANSIDVDEIGFPYTDPAVAMPAATTENGNPQGCDLTGANGVWYNFVAGGDGTANATIVTPGGASSVTFYTAPDENATETDLVLVPQQTNQCVPGTSASIYTLAGQAYYVFVLNTGAITDITIDGTNLGVSDNDIAGFSYYPNPTEGIVNLKSVENIEQVSLYNMLGQLVVSNRVDATTSQVDISGLSVGTYLMKVTVNGQIGTYKVIKN